VIAHFNFCAVFLYSR